MGARRSKKTKGQHRHTRTLFPALERLESTSKHINDKSENKLGKESSATKGTKNTAHKEGSPESTAQEGSLTQKPFAYMPKESQGVQ